MKRSLLIGTLLMALTTVWAQGPNGSGTYYKYANGKKGKELKSALSTILNSGTHNIGYDGLITAYEKTDKRADGKLRDWYSNATNYSFTDRNGNNAEGAGWNREHTVPQSWFSKASPMKSDIVHVLPTDCYVNNRRSSYPFGEVGSVEWSSKNSYSKLGSCKTSGYSGKVFEPNDEIKGDIARIYFYMITRYEDRCGNWSGGVFTKTYPGLVSWTLNMMMRWSKQDPVDAREIARNNAVQETQWNRNPFVDYPGLEEYTWGSKMDQAFSYDNFEGGAIPVDDYVYSPTFSQPDGTYEKSVEVAITTTTDGATIYYTTDGSDATTSSTRYNSPITLTTTTTLKAIAVKDGKTSYQATAIYTIVGEGELPENPESAGGEVFYESFDDCASTGGNDNIWSGQNADGTFESDNDGWTYVGGYSGNQCARFGSGSKSGEVTSPEITLTTSTSTLTFNAAPFGSDGTSLAVSVVGTGVTISPSSFTMEKEKWKTFTATLTGTGTIRLKFTPVKRFFLDEVRVVESNIESSATVVTAPTAKTLTYTGSAQQLVNTGVASGGTMQYSLDGTTYSTSIPTGTNAESYTVYYKVVGDASHSDTTPATVSVTIEKAPLTISGGTYTMRQGEELPEFVATYEGFVNNETEEVLTTKPMLTTTATSASDPGEYAVTVSGAEAQNYNITYEAGTLTITEATGIRTNVNDSDKVNDSRYTIDGRKLLGKPTQKGIYVHNGIKVVIK